MKFEILYLDYKITINEDQINVRFIICHLQPQASLIYVHIVVIVQVTYT